MTSPLTSHPPISTPIDTDDLPACPCHDTVDCPDRATVAIAASQLLELADLLAVIDEFLRCGNGAASRLVDFCARRGERHPGFSANNLIDAVSFTAAGLQQQATQHAAERS
jgi:hypothetical protein